MHTITFLPDCLRWLKCKIMLVGTRPEVAERLKQAYVFLYILISTHLSNIAINICT